MFNRVNIASCSVEPKDNACNVLYLLLRDIDKALLVCIASNVNSPGLVNLILSLGLLAGWLYTAVIMLAATLLSCAWFLGSASSIPLKFAINVSLKKPLPASPCKPNTADIEYIADEKSCDADCSWKYPLTLWSVSSGLIVIPPISTPINVLGALISIILFKFFNALLIDPFLVLPGLIKYSPLLFCKLGPANPLLISYEYSLS